jgi:hypothetical protein
MIENNNNLEKYFRSQFNRNPEPEPWNTPDEKVWEQISHTLQHKENKPRNLIWIPILSSFILLGMLLLALTRIISKNEIIEKLQSDLMECQTVSSSGLGMINNANQITETANEKKLTDKKSFYRPIPKPKSKKNVIPAISDKEEIGDKSFYYPNNNHSDIISDQNLSNVQNSLISDSATEAIILTNAFNDDSNSDIHGNYIIETDSYQLMNMDSNLISEQEEEPETINIDKSFLTAIGFTSGTTNWFSRNTGNAGSNTFVQNEYFTSSLHAGLVIRQKISDRFTIESGINLLKRSLNTSYLLGVHYAHQNESIAPDGSIDYHLDHNLETGMGTIDVEMLLNREKATQVMPDEMVNMEFSVRSTGTIIDWPVNLLWYPIKKSGLYINAGLVSQLVMDRNIEVTNYLSHHNIVHEKDAGVKFRESNYTNLTLAVNFGAGYNMGLGNSWSLNIGGSYRKALISSYKTDKSKTSCYSPLKSRTRLQK